MPRDIRQVEEKDMTLPMIWPGSMGRSDERVVGTETAVATWELWYENWSVLSLPRFLVVTIRVGKKCAPLHCRILKASPTTNSALVFPAAQSRLILDLLQTDKLLQHTVEATLVCPPQRCYQVEALQRVIAQYMTQKFFFNMIFRCLLCWQFKIQLQITKSE